MKNKGFMLIEMIIVMTIVIILSSFSISLIFSNYEKNIARYDKDKIINLIIKYRDRDIDYIAFNIKDNNIQVILDDKIVDEIILDKRLIFLSNNKKREDNFIRKKVENNFNKGFTINIYGKYKLYYTIAVNTNNSLYYPMISINGNRL